MRQLKPEGSNAKKRFILLSSLSCLLVSIWYLNHSDTSNTLSLAQQNNSELLQITNTSESKVSQDHNQLHSENQKQAVSSTPDINSQEDEQFPKQEKLLAKVMENFQEMEQVLENIDHPSVQEFIEALPPESQKTLKMAALKQSVSKRLDIVEANPLSPIDLQSLNQDIDKLAENFVMMPEEARQLKAYLQQRTKS